MRIDRSAFQRLTGYTVTAQSDQKATVAVPGKKPIELPLAALEQMQRSYETLQGPAQAQTAVSGVASRTGNQLRADLNRSLFDSSPFVITDREVRSAFKALMRTPPAALSQVIGDLPDVMLNRLFVKLADAEPFRVDAGTSPLTELATKLALELDPVVGKTLVSRLDDEGKRLLLEGAVSMPSGALLGALRETLGDDGWRALCKGSKDDSLVGRGLVDGRFYDENVTADFQTKYAAASSLPLPKGAADVVYLGGPGLLGDQLPGYLEPNFTALEDWGVPKENTHKLVYNTAGDPKDNADAIYAQIKAHHDGGKRVVVMGHSKFGRDMLEAFARHPDLTTMVDGVLMMQPAFSAQVARDLARPELKKLLDPVLQIVGGDRSSFDGLSTPFEELPTWPAEVPTVVMASSTESKKALLRPVADHYYECVYNAASDGLVALQDQVAVNGAAVVTLPGLADHAQPGLKFASVCEHFAIQIEEGAPDDVVRGMLERLKALAPHGVVDVAIKLWEKAHDTPQERARCVKALREAGPLLDRVAVAANRAVGFDLVDNGAMTKALMSQLFARMPHSRA